MTITTARQAARLATLAARIDRGEHTTGLIAPTSTNPADRVTFFLGTHRPHWLTVADVPLFISAHTLNRWRTTGDDWPTRKAGRFGCGIWALDSGGYTELRDHGGWRQDADAYGGMVARLVEEVGALPEFAAPQDWMCEPWVMAGGTHQGQHFVGTGLTLSDHQELTVENLCYLREQFPFVPWMPVLQGLTLADYQRCADLYAAAGIDLAAERRVGLGSVCRRESTDEIAEIVTHFAGRGYRLHGFGVKTDGLRRYAGGLRSADSLAWSFAARRRTLRLPDTAWGGCTHTGICNNCPRWAMVWRELVLAAMRGDAVDVDLGLLAEATAEADAATGQMSLFDLAA